MKNRLGRIKTTVNDEGNYDQETYFKEQKLIYAREIDFATRVDEITERKFAMKPFDIGFLNSMALKDEQKFKDVKKIFKDYNKSVLQEGDAAKNGLHLKTVVMDSMLKFMRLMLLAPDTESKVLILNIAYHWFIKHLDPKATKKNTNELLKEIREIITEKKLLPIDIVNKELILTKVNEQLYPYKIGARTMFKEIDDPITELDNYNTHKLEFVNGRVKHDKSKEEKEKWIDTLKFPKIEPLPYEVEIVEPEILGEEITGNNKVENEIGTSPDGQILPSGEAPVEGQENANIEIGPEVDLGDPAEGEPDQVEEEEVIEDKKRGKLDPLLKAFVLDRIRKKEKQEYSCDKLREIKANSINMTNNEDLLSGNYMREWAKKRARIKTEIARKNQHMKGLEKIFRGTQEDSSEKFIENEKVKIKLKSTISEHKKNITMIETSEELSSEVGTSLFDRRRIKTEASHKPFSSILSDHSRKIEEAETLEEISKIKERFSKYKLYTPLNNFFKGLVPPEEEEMEANAKTVWPHSQLPSNPFIKISKKKKKKKKK